MLYVEPVVIPEVYIDGIAAIEQRGPNLKLCFYSLQKPVCGTAVEAVIVARFVMPISAVARAAMLALAASETAVTLDQVN